MSLAEMLQSMAPEQRSISGIAMAVVTNNKDPNNLGRVKVKYPWRNIEDESHWARIMTFMGGKEMGGYFLPEVNDEVIVAFDKGDIDHPIIIGSLWSKPMPPPENNADGENNRRLIKSRSGHIFRFDDKKGKEKIEIIDKDGINSIVIDTAEDTITITSEKDIILKAPDGQVLIEAGEINLKSSKSTTVKAGKDFDTQASGNHSAKATQVKINASAAGKFEAGGPLDLKSSAIAQMKASLIKLN